MLYKYYISFNKAQQKMQFFAYVDKVVYDSYMSSPIHTVKPTFI